MSAPAYSEIGIAHHEAGHAVGSVLLDFPYAAKLAMIEPDAADGWRGRVSYHEGEQPYTDPTTTPPHQWKRAVSVAWTGLAIGYLGPAAARRFDGFTLDAEGIRSDWGGVWDEEKALEIARHYWPPQHQDEVLNASAMLAGMLVQVPRVWTAVEAVAVYLMENARHRAGTAEMETIIRRTLPVSVVCPETEWALSISL